MKKLNFFKKIKTIYFNKLWQLCRYSKFDSLLFQATPKTAGVGVAYTYTYTSSFGCRQLWIYIHSSFFVLEMHPWFTRDYRDMRSYSHRTHAVLNLTHDKVVRKILLKIVPLKIRTENSMLEKSYENSYARKFVHSKIRTLENSYTGKSY